MDTLWLTLAYAKVTGKMYMQFEKPTAFLYGNMDLFKGFEDQQGKVCLLNKSIYGL